MKLTKVNNFLIFFLYRYFAILIFCLFTILLTGNIADDDHYLGYNQDGLTPTIGGRTGITIMIFSALNFIISSKAVIITIIAAASSAINYLICKNYFDKNNFKNWALLLMCPGLLIYTNAPTKEFLFFYPAILYVILECNFLLFKEKDFLKNSAKLLFKFAILAFIIYWRGPLATPYLILAIFSLLIRFGNLGKIRQKVNLRFILFISFIGSTLFNFLINKIDGLAYEEIVFYLRASFSSEISIFRSFINYDFLTDPINSLYIQYLALFPSLEELINKPYLVLIIIESIILVYVFFVAWKTLFITIRDDYIAKKIFSLIFIFISISYFSIYGYLGSFNIGSSQRFRVNFIPIAIILPIILEKQIRRKYFLKSKSPNL